MKWTRLNGQAINKNIVTAVEDVLVQEKQLGNKLKVYIGTDSQVYGKTANFATVIVFLREKKGGFMFVSKDRIDRVMSLKERMITEVARSVEVAYSLCDTLDKHHVGLEVHADINTDPNFKSNIALSEAMGYIMAMGFEFKAKPNAFASSSCADKMV